MIEQPCPHLIRCGAKGCNRACQPSRIAAWLQALAGACAIAALVGWVGPMLDAGPDRDAPTQAERMAHAFAASRAADAAQCQATYGPNATAVHLPDGQHRCADKRGRRLPTPTGVR